MSSLWTIQMPGDVGNLDEDLRVVDANGRVLCALGLTATLYIERGDRPVVREGLLCAYERCVQMTGNAFSWGADPETGEPRPTTTHVGDVRAWPPDVFQRFDFQMAFHGGADVDDASAYSFVAVSREREEGQLSYLSVSLPWAWAENHEPADYVKWVLEICSYIGPCHGYAGPAVVAHVAGVDDAASAAIYSLGRRFRGLEIDFPQQHEPHLSTKREIKGINWLTILEERWINQVGGLEAVSKIVGEQVSLHPFVASAAGVSGFVLQAGAAPKLGDISAPEGMDEYRSVARLLLPIRTVYPAVIWPQGMPGFDFGESRDWMRRFDDPHAGPTGSNDEGVG